MDMKQSSPDVLIYLDKLKRYIFSDNDIRDFFLKDIDQGMFFEKVTEFSESNLKENGEPDLTRQQLEQIKIELQMMAQDKKENELFFNNFSLN